MANFVLSAFSDEAGKSLAEQIAALKRNGIRYMEIRGVDGMNISKIPLATVAEYKKQLDEAGIRVLTIGSPVGKIKLQEDWEAHVADFLHLLGAARILEAKRIRMFSIFTDTPAEDEDIILARMEELLELAEAAGVTLYHENEKGIYGDNDERVLRLVDEFAGRMEFIFDPANFIQCDVDPKTAYAKLKEAIDYFHVKDALKESGEVVPAGAGDGAIADILTDFAKDRENVMLTVEPHLKSFDGLKDHTSMKSEPRHIYKDNNESFDVAVTALKNILKERGLSYEEIEGCNHRHRQYGFCPCQTHFGGQGQGYGAGRRLRYRPCKARLGDGATAKRGAVQRLSQAVGRSYL